MHTKASQALRAACKASASYASPAQKLQADLEGEVGDLDPPLADEQSQARPPQLRRVLAAEELVLCEVVWALGFGPLWGGAKAPLWHTMCLFGGCNAIVAAQPVCCGASPHPLCGQCESLQAEQWADVRRLQPPACGYGADTHRPPVGMRLNVSTMLL